jgi:hypothetical protein
MSQAAWNGAGYEFVQACWDDARHCLLFDCYYGHKLHSVRNWNRGMEIVVAVTASGSAIAGWAFWTTMVGGYIWGGLGAIAATIAVIKPFLNLGATIESYSKLITEYRAVNAALENTIFNIQQRDRIADEDRKRFDDLRNRRQKADLEMPERVDAKQVSSCQARVLQDRPADSLWAPKVPGHHPKVP